MSDHVTKPSQDAGAISGSSKRPSGMFDWMRRIAKPPVPTRKSSTVLHKEKAELMSGNIMVNNNCQKLDKEKPPAVISEPNSDSCSLTLSLSLDGENSLKLRNQTEDEIDQSKPVGGPSSSSLRCDEKHMIPDMSEEQELVVVGSCTKPLDNRMPTCLPADQLKHEETSGQVVAFEKQFSSDNFACIDIGSHELEQCDGDHVQHDPFMAKNFFPFFHRKQNMCRAFLSTDKSLPCSVHKVETMRICTMVDSLETRARGPPKISLRAHQFQFTKETCVNLSKDHQTSGERRLTACMREKSVSESARSSPLIQASCPKGVRIEPLSTISSYAGAKMTGNPLISKTDSRNESSVQHGTMQIDDGRNQLVIPSGTKDMALSSLQKDHSLDETVRPSTEKPRSKRPISELPDMNEEIPTLQPEGSSTDSKEVSIATVHSLNAQHIFQHPSKPDFSLVQDPPDANNDKSSRWIKRLRLSSSNEYCVGTENSDTGEPSDHRKCGEFLNKRVKTSVDDTDQNTDSLKNSESPPNCPIDGIKNWEDHSCPWVQRWWKDTNFGSNLSLKKIDPWMFCESDSVQIGVDEIGKRQFPSIGAMALMGKTMNGFRSCEIKKKGSVFVWNTKEY